MSKFMSCKDDTIFFVVCQDERAKGRNKVGGFEDTTGKANSASQV